MDPKTSTVRPLRTNPQSVIPVWLAIAILVASGLIGGFSGWALSAKSSAKSETPSQSVVTSKSSGIKDT
ncbi:MAG: hypothetical protein WAT44_02560, partial [Microgenomates group bacterium]